MTDEPIVQKFTATELDLLARLAERACEERGTHPSVLIVEVTGWLGFLYVRLAAPVTAWAHFSINRRTGQLHLTDEEHEPLQEVNL